MMIVEASLRITVVAATVALLLAAMRVRSSATRHAIWTMVLAAMMVMPVLQAVMPVLPLPLPAVRATFTRAPVPWPASRIPLPQHDADVLPQSAKRQPMAPPSSSTHAAISPASDVARSLPPPATLLMATYVAGVLFFALRLAAGWRRVTRLVRAASPVAIECPVEARESERLAAPLTAGIIRPVMLLPRAWKRWPAAKLQACLAHEIAHVERHDPSITFLAQVNRCIFWCHPLAWWLEQALRAYAEDAADEMAAQAIGDRRRYAEVLLDIADTVRLHGGRVAWQGLGADGAGRLGHRIDRLLSTDGAADLSRKRQAIVFGACAAAIVMAAACRPPAPSAPAPLQPDPEVAERLQRRQRDQAAYQAAANMTAEEVNALERSLKRTPEDLETLKKLRHFYQQSGQKVFGWNGMIERRRPHILWLIENHPGHDLARWPVSSAADPIGYAEAKQRWLAQTAKADAGEDVLLNAAAFLSHGDSPLVEQLLLRAKANARTPDRARALAGRLGYFYADVMTGRVTQAGIPVPAGNRNAPEYVSDVRRRLRELNDATSLSAAGSMLARVFGNREQQQFGIELLRRAVQLDPDQRQARELLAALEGDDERQARGHQLRTRAAAIAGLDANVAARGPLTPEEQRRLRAAYPQVIAELPETERLPMLVNRATSDYDLAEWYAWEKDRVSAEAGFARSKKYAEDAVALAARLTQHPDYSRAVYDAKVALALHALRAGDMATSVRLMLEAARVPSSPSLTPRSVGLDSRLVNYLLKEGERETVVEFLERSAELRAGDREQLLKDAAAIRAGKMPERYQYMLAREFKSTP